MSGVKRRGLHRSLDELLSDFSEPASSVPVEAAVLPNQELRQIPIHRLQPSRFQPRRDFAPESLQELAESIRAQGILQPIVVRALGEERYEIIAGERRWRAAQLAGLLTVPVLVKDITDKAAMALALIENIQRENLNPVEEAFALQRLLEEFSLTHEQIAQSIGKSRAAVTNLLRILQLQEEVQRMLRERKIDLGHAKVLLGLSGEQQLQAAQQIVSRSFSVRETERLVKELQKNPQKSGFSVLPKGLTPILFGCSRN